MNKKGSGLDIIYILAFLFTFAIITIVAFTFYSGYTDSIADNPLFDNEVNEQVESQAVATLHAWDYLFVFIMIGLTITTLMGGFMLRTHPAFFWISLLLLIIAIVIAAILGNVFGSVTSTAAFSSAAGELSVIPFIMNHLPLMILLIGGIILVILFAKNKMMEY
jgi:hypothetical protein